jgi:hypothetical protein
MNTNVLAAGVIGFLLGGLTVSIAAELEDDEPAPPSHGASVHSTQGIDLWLDGGSTPTARAEVDR